MADNDQNGLVLQLSADIRKLEKAFERASGVVKTRSKQMENSATSLEKFFGKPSLGKALDKTFDATRFKILDSGAARVGLFGSALESLGPAGLVAAAGVGAVAAAFAGAREAAKFADDIADTANRLHVTTDALQEYRFAIRAAGGEEKGADEALESFSETLGKAHQGLTKAQKGFIAIGFTKAQIDSMTDVDSALQQVAEKLVGLSAADRDAAISQLGLTGLKEVLDGGAGKIAALREEAQRLGIVMDSELVKRGGELNDQFETVQKVIDVQLKSALVDLGPILVGLLGLMGDMAKVAADVADAFRSIETRTTRNLQSQLADLKQQKAAGVPGFNRNERLLAKVPLVGPTLAVGDLARRALAAKDVDKNIARLEAELARRVKANTAAPIKPTKTLVNTAKTGSAKSGPRDDSAQRTESVNAAIAGAEREVLQAMLGLTADVEARANLQKQIIDAELAQRQAGIAKQAADINADKGLSAGKRQELLKQLEIVEARTAEAAALEKQRIDREAADELAKQGLDLAQTRLDGEAELLQLQGDLTFSESTRAQIAVRLVDLAYQREKAELEAVIAAQKVAGADTRVAEAKLAALNAAQPGRVEDAQSTGSEPARQANSIVQGVSKQTNLAEDTAAMYAEIDRLRQADTISEAVAAQAKAEINARYHEQRLSNAQSFFGNLATLTQSGNKTLHAIGKAAAIAQATIDGILAVQKALASAPPPLNFVLAAAAGVAAAVNVAKIAGLADGGRVSGPGGPTDDRVPIWASDGEYVVNARATQRNLALLEHINSGRSARFAAGGQVGRPLAPIRLPQISAPARASSFAVVQPVHFDLRGAVTTPALLADINAKIARSHAQARQLAVQDVNAQRYLEDLNS